MSVDKILSAYPQLIESLKKEGISRFRKFQEQAIDNGLLSGKSLLVTTPTGSGKTLIGELAILNSLLGFNERKALFLVPLKAVANEKYEEFSKKYADLFKVNVSTGDYETIPEELTESNLIIATYERFDSLLRTQPKWLSDIATVVIDEVHMIGEPERGPRLESVIIRLRENLPYTQLICLSATVKNWHELSEWLGCVPINSDERPVPLHIEIRKTSNKFNSIKKLIETTVQKKGQALVFVMTRKDAEFLAKHVANQLGHILKPKNIALDVKSISGFAIKLRNALRKGIGYHHAGLIASDRHIVEEYFKHGLIKVIVCTTTLAAGINVPARLVVLKDTELKGSRDKDLILRKLNSNEIFQILGRAGRPRLDLEGLGVILVSDDQHKEKLQNTLYQQTSDGRQIERYEPILSQFDDVSTLREQALIKIYEKGAAGLSEEKLISFFKRTFWAYLERKRDRNTLPMYLGRQIKDILADIAPKSVFDKGKLLRSEVALLDVSSNRLLGRVGNYVVSFDEDKGRFCTCGSFKSSPIKICQHIIAFSLFCDAHKELQAYTKTIVRTALEEDIFTYLRQANLIKMKDGKYIITDFGRVTVLYYIRPETSQKIRDVLLDMSDYTTEKILLLSAQMLTTEFSINKYSATELFDTLWRWINERDLNEVLKTIEPGDFESVRSSINWILNAILGVGRSMGSYTEDSLKELIDPLMERIRVGVKEELTNISPFFEYTDRKKLRRLYKLGIKTVADLINKRELFE